MILTPDNEYAVLIDACALVPMPLCDTLLRMAVEPSLYRPLWSELILSEVGTAMERMGYTKAQAGRRLNEYDARTFSGMLGEYSTRPL